MDADLLRREINHRDERVKDIDGFLPNTLSSLEEHKMIKIPQGFIWCQEFVDTQEDDSWGSTTRQAEMVIRFTPHGEGDDQYFKLDLKFDSWEDREWYIYGDIKEVRQVPVQRMIWEEVV